MNINRNLNSEYFDWMYRIICDNKRLSYKKILKHLHDTRFVYSIDMDGNRADDGVDLRYRFGYEMDYDDLSICHWLDTGDCSVLEMMVALTLRCEEHIMSDPEFGDRTDKWFWIMMDSLGLSFMDDLTFSQVEATLIIDRFQNREYESNGVGGLFIVENTEHDMRDMEIWTQMCLCLNEKFA